MMDGSAGMLPEVRVLVVDDQEMNRELLGAMLEMLGYDAEYAEDGLQALRKVTPATDLILLDLMMPGMDGRQVLERLKRDEALRHIPVVMVSALNDLETVAACIKLGAEDYLPKPINRTLLQARVQACLEKKRFHDRELSYIRQIEAEKKRSDDLLRVIFPDPIVEELKATDRVQPRLCHDVGVLFCDVVGFTPYCEKQSPADVLECLQDLVVEYEQLTVSHGMQKIKTTGDAFLATAGLLAPMENPALHCVECGLEMVEAARRHRAGWMVRVGLHVGPVIAGLVGRQRYLFDLWGDTVNTAARVESHGTPDAVNVSHEVWRRVSDSYVGESLGTTLVKGKGTMELFRIVDRKSPHGTVHALSR